VIRPLSQALRRFSEDVPGGQADEELLQRFLARRDETAFEALVRRHGPMVLGVCRRILRDPHDAEDAFQATFLVLVRKAASLGRRDLLGPWLHAVARRTACKASTQRASRRAREVPATLDAAAAECPPESVWEELRPILDEEVGRLPEKYRVPFVLHHLHGNSYDEVAARTGRPKGTVATWLARARELLRERLQGRGVTLSAAGLALLLAEKALAAVPGPLVTNTVKAATSFAAGPAAAGAIPARVAALTRGVLQVMAIDRLKHIIVVGLSLVLLGATAAVAGRVLTTSQEPPQGPTKAAGGRAAKDPQEVRDRFNDPLPKGAVARLGTIAFRHGWATWGRGLTFTPDGKHLLSTGCGLVRRWDLATGHASINLGESLGGGDSGTSFVTPDGKLARICFQVRVGRGVTTHCAEHDLESGKQRTYPLEFPRETEDAHGLPQAMSPDGKTFAELTHNGALTLWNAADGTFANYVKPQGGAYTAMAFHPDGKSLLVGDDGHNLRVFDLATCQERRSFGIHTNRAVAQAVVSPDGRWLATAGRDRNDRLQIGAHDRVFRLWDLKQGSVARAIEIPEEPRTWVLSFSPDSRTLVAGIRQFKGDSRVAVRTWDVATGKPGRAWTGDPTLGAQVALSPDGKTLATMNEHGVIRLWETGTGKEKDPPEASPGALQAVCFRPDGKTIVTFGQDLGVRAWEAATGRLMGPPRMRVEGSYPQLLAGGRLLTVRLYRDGNASILRLHDPATGKLLLERPGIWLIASHDGERVAVTDRDARIQVIELGTGKVLQTRQPSEAERAARSSYPLLTGAFTPDGQALVLLGETVSVWDVATGKPRSSWSLAEKKLLNRPGDGKPRTWERVEAFAVSPDARRIAFSLLKDLPGEKGVQRWFCRVVAFETATGKLLHQTDVAEESFRQLAFSPDGRRLAVGGRWTVRVWDLGTERPVRAFAGHRGTITALAFSPDGRRLASASEDSTALIWDVSK
jgi:RNA polymerase sigma factor (sigma-70 family)